MAKKGFFSWLGFGKNKDQQDVAEEQKQAEQPAIESEVEAGAAEIEEALQEQQAREAAEQARLAAEAEAAEQARLAAEAEAAEQARLAAEAEAVEQARLAAEAEAAEQARLAAEAEALARAEEEARLAAEEEAAEQARLAEEATKEEADRKAEKAPKKGLFARLKQGLLKTRQNLGSGFFGLFSGKKIDDELFEELETQLLTADLGVETTLSIIDNLTRQASRRQLKDGEALYELLKEEMGQILDKVDKPLVIDSEHKPYVILMVGVNGVGKTTTIGKLARQFQAEGKSVMLAAGDTFRAAAVEQLQVWGERNDIPVIAQHTGADAASVIFDAVEAARARKVDVLIADTAGRLQNKAHLMDELKKIVRVMQKADGAAPHEIMLTLDAGTGQNALSQAKVFNEAVPITGITLSKLDGTAKGGVIFAVADKFGIPIRYIGVGEKIDDLRPFNSREFIDALFTQEE
ncbi:signal recognition particle-docking protein FtsY [Oceanisphaera psychrotolerans]|uniref:Signal recognition particle receptor FtsY n=1 Tax=Oceanisphaera psychrotolerans TaxID=1414654 RepID=A0A1J4QD43_9GAMM|nr:signal recognition particle-docking protein FtsY [Oceanisphaera psychrotolerans]OIN04780.1 signal recognition particle-docking protein FtsY [Oceanisphaera psychrotolerans]